MKNRDVRRRDPIEARKIHEHDVIEVGGVRIRCDRVVAEKGLIKITKIPTDRRPVQIRRFNPRKKVTLVRR